MNIDIENIPSLGYDIEIYASDTDVEVALVIYK